VGDEVFGGVRGPKSGSYAELVVGNASGVGIKPSELTFEEAAGE